MLKERCPSVACKEKNENHTVHGMVLCIVFPVEHGEGCFKNRREVHRQVFHFTVFYSRIEWKSEKKAQMIVRIMDLYYLCTLIYFDG
jgi:hypothetical protein